MWEDIVFKIPMSWCKYHDKGSCRYYSKPSELCKESFCPVLKEVKKIEDKIDKESNR